MPGDGGGGLGRGNPFDADAMQYMDDEWWRQPKGEGMPTGARLYVGAWL